MPPWPRLQAWWGDIRARFDSPSYSVLWRWSSFLQDSSKCIYSRILANGEKKSSWTCHAVQMPPENHSLWSMYRAYIQCTKTCTSTAKIKPSSRKYRSWNLHKNGSWKFGRRKGNPRKRLKIVDEVKYERERRERERRSKIQGRKMIKCISSVIKCDS